VRGDDGPPYAVPIKSSFSGESADPWRLRPHTLQATKNRPPRMAAPPTPTETPIIAFLVDLDMPEELDDSSLARVAELVGEVLVVGDPAPEV